MTNPKIVEQRNAQPIEGRVLVFELRGEQAMFTHIAYIPEILSGRLHILGTCLSIEFILDLFANGATIDEVLKSYPQLTAEAVEEALKYGEIGI